MPRLEGKVAIVTGGGSGIGRATSALFAKEGAKVVVGDIVREKGEETVDQIKGLGGDASSFVCDVSTSRGAQRLVTFCVTRYGRIDVLFNNAGITGTLPVTDTSEEKWDQVVAVNLKSVFLCSKYAIPHMIKGGGGAIVNTASTVGLVGSPNQASYCASKGGVLILTKAMALDHAKQKIRVNCICPGLTMTPMVEDWLAEYSEEERNKMLEMLKGMHPLGRYSQPEEMAYGVLYLASEEASFVTGVALPIDGGWTAQ